MKEQQSKEIKFSYTASVLPCPFCGGWNITLTERESDFDDDGNYLVCEDCWAYGPGAGTPTKAIEIWNTRKEPKPVPENKTD